MSDNPKNPSQEAERYKQAQERELQRRNLAREKAVVEAFEQCPHKFKQSPEETLRFLGDTVRFVDGKPYVGDRTLGDALLGHAKGNPMAVASTTGEIWDQGLSSVKSKEGMSRAEKVQFVNDHGEMAFARLPLKAEVPFNPDAEDASFAAYVKLPYTTKNRLAEERGLTLAQLAARMQRKESQRIASERLVGIPQGGKKK